MTQNPRKPVESLPGIKPYHGLPCFLSCLSPLLAGCSPASGSTCTWALLGPAPCPASGATSGLTMCLSESQGGNQHMAVVLALSEAVFINPSDVSSRSEHGVPMS